MEGSKSCFPPGFRFHPTDEELVLYYLKRKICGRRLELDVIAEADVYKFDPQDLPGLSNMKTGDRQWYFFSPRANKARSNRGTVHGYWKATGKDRAIASSGSNARTVGVKKTLVFYIGRAPAGERTDWVMHEYTLDEGEMKRLVNVKNYYALYKVFKKSGAGPRNGEEYGAPFNEEDWEDDESVVEISSLMVKRNPVENLGTDRLEEIMNFVPNEPAAVVVSPFIPPINYYYETPSTVVDNSLQVQVYEASEVTSVGNIDTPELPDTEFIADFLELDDLLGPEPPDNNNNNNPVQNFHHDNIDGLNEVDLFPDASMFLSELGPSQSGQVPQLYMNDFENEMVNYFPSDTNQFSCDSWERSERGTISNLTESNQGCTTQTSDGWFGQTSSCPSWRDF